MIACKAFPQAADGDIRTLHFNHLQAGEVHEQCMRKQQILADHIRQCKKTD